MQKPDHVFEISWEVCNMVGGIHTVIQSKASHMLQKYGENYICVGPHVPHPISSNPSFREEIWDESIYKLIQDLGSHNVTCQMGRWLIPGEPRTLLIGFRDLFEQKNRILTHYWEKFGINSLFGGFDYFEPVLFSHASALLIEQIYNRIFFPQGQRVLVHAHEWMSAVGLLHLKETAPEIATVFTTHATMLGRSLSSNESYKPLKFFLSEKPATKWAHEIGIESKHSVEVIVAREADCFTTVSETTSEECESILSKKPDFVVQNGLSNDVPSQEFLDKKFKKRMRQRLLNIASEVTGYKYDLGQTFITVSSGRYEFKNKGIDLYLDAILDLRESLKKAPSDKKILAFVMCPAGHLQRVHSHSPEAFLTHQLVDPQNDPVLRLLRGRAQINSPQNSVHVIFLPLYLNGTDPTLPETYWELLAGTDLAIFPSWYEPWGYTPHEAVSLGIPTITTDCAGFGRWIESVSVERQEKGVSIIQRARCSEQDTYDIHRGELKDRILEYILASEDELQKRSLYALEIAQKARWNDLIEGYWKAYSFALEQVEARILNNPQSKFRSFSLGHLVAPSPFSSARANVRHFSVTTRLPSVVQSLQEFMERTITWKWNPKLMLLLSRLDPELWTWVDQNPGKFIKNTDDQAVKRILAHPELRKLSDDVKRDFEAKASKSTDYERAYFCMEYGITDELRIYSGGLGILAGDHLKTASDLEIPLVAFGLFYQYGYFRQTLGLGGQQLAHYHRSEIENLRLNLVQDNSGGRLLLSIPFQEEIFYFQVWSLDLSGVRLYLLDANVMENSPRLRNVTDRLYGSETGKRIKQEWLLSMGGLELIRNLNLGIKVFHMNEGHTAFIVVGRTLQLMREKHLSFDEAFDYVRFSTIFTTHTPVPAGHDEFSLDETVPLLQGVIQDKEVLDRFIALGSSLKQPGDDHHFSMTALAMRGSRWVNAVSKIHKKVSQRMFNNLYPDLDEHEVPITHVTNGVHIPSWLEPDWQSFFYDSLGDQWPKRTLDREFWNRLENVPLEKIWEVKLGLKKRLLDWLRKRLSHDLDLGGYRPEYARVLANLDPNTLIITHAKRMAPYKRADLLFQEPDRLYDLIKNSPAPILFIYAGKAHPADGLGQEIIHRISQWSRDPRFMGSVLILEDYDLSFSRRLISGSDIWLNTPLRPLEASGTSGMKAAINGTLHLSVADGWWPEVYNGKNGWMIGDGSELWDHSLQDRFDCSRIFHLLQNEVLRSFVPPAGQDFSRTWVSKVRESILSSIPFVSSERMIQDYEERLYNPALKAARKLENNHFEQLKRLNVFKKTLSQNWSELQFDEVDLGELGKGTTPRSHPAAIVVELTHPGLKPEHVRVQAVLSGRVSSLQVVERSVVSLDCVSSQEVGKSQWRLFLGNRKPGDYSLAFRATAQQYSDFEDSGFELRMVKWM